MAKNTQENETERMSAFNNFLIKYNPTAIGSDYGHVLYHIVIVPRYRRMVFKTKEARSIFTETAKACAVEKGFAINHIDFGHDYVSLDIEASPYVSPRTIASQLKIYSTKALISRVESLKAAKSIWTKHFFVTTYDSCPGLSTEEQAKEYAKRQIRHS